MSAQVPPDWGECVVLALTMHKDKKPSLGKGTAFLPIASWRTARGPLRVLRSVDRQPGSQRSDFLTLVQLPEDQAVALIVGDPSYARDELDFHPLNNLPAEDQEQLREWLAREIDLPDLSSDSAGWLVRLVLGAPLPRSCLHWTKDIRLLEQGRRKSSTKRY